MSQFVISSWGGTRKLPYAFIKAKMERLERNDEDNLEAINDLSEDMRLEIEQYTKQLPLCQSKNRRNRSRRGRRSGSKPQKISNITNSTDITVTPASLSGGTP